MRFLILCLLIPVSLYGQEKRFRVGMQINPVLTFSNANSNKSENLTNYRPDIFDFSSVTVGSMVGIRAEYSYDRLGISSGLFHSMQNYTFKQTRFPGLIGVTGTFSEKTRLTSILIPVGIIYKFYEAQNNNRVYLKAGCAYNYTGITGGSTLMSVQSDSGFQGAGAFASWDGFKPAWEIYAGASYNAFFKRKNSFDVGLSYHYPLKNSPKLNIVHIINTTEYKADISPYLTYLSFDFTIFLQKKPEN